MREPTPDRVVDISIPEYPSLVARSFSSIIVHIIFSTKEREPILKDENVQKKLHGYLGGILHAKKCLPISIGGVADHIHVLADTTRDESISEVVKELKRGSTLWLKEQSDLYRDFSWQGGYGAFSVSTSRITEVKHYIEAQQEHHKKVTFQEEYLAFLKRHNLDFESKHLWD